MNLDAGVAPFLGSRSSELSVARVIELDSIALIGDRLSRVASRGLVTRGNGCAPGDAARNGGGEVVILGGSLASAQRMTINVDSHTAIIPAGVTLDAALRTLLHQGWFLPVSPDTRQMTIGGALATDVAGTNHLSRGTLATHVNAMWIVNGQGELLTLRPGDATADMFWASVGGLGLTGVITAVELSVIPVTSAWVDVASRRYGNLPDVLDALMQPHAANSYVSAWIDTAAPTKAFGRGVVSTARLAHVSELPHIRQRDALELGAVGRVSTNRWNIRSAMNNWTVRALNEARFRAASPAGGQELRPISDHLHSRDSTASLSRTYGKRGSVRYQMCIPLDRIDVIAEALLLLAEPGRQCLWASVQRLGHPNPAPLSFAQEGWSVDLEYPADIPELGRILDDVDESVLAAGGRVNLAKDGRIRPQLIDQFYPQLPRWRAIRNTMDPHGKFTSDLARRLAL